MKAWDRIINDGKAGKGDFEMRAIFVLGTIVGGMEIGFGLPNVSLLPLWLLLFLGLSDES